MKELQDLFDREKENLLQWSYYPSVNTNFLEGEDNKGQHDDRRSVFVYQCRVCGRQFIGYSMANADQAYYNSSSTLTHICVSSHTKKPFGIGVGDFIGMAFLDELEKSAAEDSE